MSKNKKSLINISKKTFFSVIILLAALIAVSIILTYVIPSGTFGTLPNGSVDYLSYTENEDIKGIPVLQGILAPVLVFFSSDGLTLIMLSLFLMIISAAFQVMNDAGGIRSVIGYVSSNSVAGNCFFFRRCPSSFIASAHSWDCLKRCSPCSR